MKVKSLVKNHFDKPLIPDSVYQMFCNSHQQALAANNTDGSLDAIITETETVASAFSTLLNKKDELRVQQKILTQKKNAQKTAFKKAMRTKEGHFRHILETAVYQEFYPNGTKEYSKALLKHMPQLTERVAAVATRHSDTLTPALADVLSAYKTDYLTARNKQVKLFGEVKEMRSKIKIARTALAVQIHKNLHNLAVKYAETPLRVNDYFDDRFLHYKNRSTLPPSATGEEMLTGLESATAGSHTATANVPVNNVSTATTNTNAPVTAGDTTP